MAAELENRCPICLDSWEEASYVMPCLHQFCYPCIVRWAESKPECPLCKRRVSSILHSVRADDDFREHVITAPAAAPPAVQLTGGAPGQPDARGLRLPAAAQLPARQSPMAPVGGFNAYVWAFIFRIYPSVLQPMRAWLNQELGQLFEDAQEVAAAQGLVFFSLRYFGLDEECLVQMLRDALGRRTRSFVHQLIETIVHRCSREARRWMGIQNSRAAGEQVSPAAAPNPAASREGSSASTRTLQGDDGGHPSAPIATHREQEEPQEDPEEAVPGPSTRSRSHNQSSQRSRERPRRTPRRRGSSPGDHLPSQKKPRQF